MLVIGITGTYRAGKGTIVEHLVPNGFKHFSVREFIAREVEKQGGTVSRDSLIAMGNWLRRQNGADFIAQELYKEAQKFGSKSVIESLRSTAEVEALRSKGQFYLLAVDADPPVRYQRALSAGSATDNVSYEEFLRTERVEMISLDPTRQNLSKCIEIADFRLMNNGTLTELYGQIDESMAEINARMNRERRE